MQESGGGSELCSPVRLFLPSCKRRKGAQGLTDGDGEGTVSRDPWTADCLLLPPAGLFSSNLHPTVPEVKVGQEVRVPILLSGDPQFSPDRLLEKESGEEEVLGS